MMPPTSDIVLDSIKNCRSTSRLRAPIALRMPISRVRSVTETSIMFMMTIPPTTREMAAIAIIAMKKLPLMDDHIPRKLALVSIAKLSSWPGRS